MPTVESINRAQMKKKTAHFQVGDNVKVHVKVVEGTRERIQIFQGLLIARSGSGIHETFTVRKISFGVGVERIFPVHSPRVEKVEVVGRGHVRQAKLYFLRKRVGRKATRLKEKYHVRIKDEDESIIEDVIEEEILIEEVQGQEPAAEEAMQAETETAETEADAGSEAEVKEVVSPEAETTVEAEEVAAEAEVAEDAPQASEPADDQAESEVETESAQADNGEGVEGEDK